MWTQPGAQRAVGPALISGPDDLGDQLKCYFDSLTVGPTPDRLMRLAEALEAALERGDLPCCGQTRRS